MTGERIRGKIANSKRKGLCMGGPVLLGYDVGNRKLVPTPGEASLVRQIMRRYLELGSVVQLADELNDEGHRTKVQRRTSGPHRGGCIFRRGTLYHLLSNRIYIGQLSHKGEWFAGEHPPIVPIPLWVAVQHKLKDRASGSSRRLKAAQPALLIGLLGDGEGAGDDQQPCDHAREALPLLVSRPDLLDGSPAWRVNAHDLEALVLGRLAEHLTNRAIILYLATGSEAQTLDRAIKAAANAAILREGRASRTCELLQNIVKVSLQIDRIELTIDQTRIAQLLGLDPSDAPPLALSLPVIKVRHGHQLRLIIPGAEAPKSAEVERDEKLVALLAEAHAARQLVLEQPDQSLGAIAASRNRCRTRLGKMVALFCPAPDIVTMIMEGRQPAAITARSLMNIDLPLAWSEQRRALGIG